MEAERATFAFENEPWARVIGEWFDDAPNAAAEFRPASDLLDRLDEFASANDHPWHVTNAAELGSKLSTYRNELGELYELEIDEGGDRNHYRFTAGRNDHRPVGLGRF